MGQLCNLRHPTERSSWIQQLDVEGERILPWKDHRLTFFFKRGMKRVFKNQKDMIDGSGATRHSDQIHRVHVGYMEPQNVYQWEG